MNMKIGRRQKLCQLPSASVTNYHKFNGLKQQGYIILEFQQSEVLKSGCQQGCIPSGDSRGEISLLPPSAFRSHLHFSTHGPFYLQVHQHSIFRFQSPSLAHFLSPSHTSTPISISLLFSAALRTFSYFRPTWIIQDSTHSLKTLI